MKSVSIFFNMVCFTKNFEHPVENLLFLILLLIVRRVQTAIYVFFMELKHCNFFTS